MRFYFFFIIGRERKRVESREFSTKKKTTTLTLTLVVVVVVVAFLIKTALLRAKTLRKSRTKERATAKKGKNFYAEKILSIEIFPKSKSFLNPNKP